MRRPEPSAGRYYALAAELWIIARWVALKLIALILSSTFGHRRRAERLVIAIGNRLFPATYPKSLFENYESYFEGYQATINDYSRLLPLADWLERKVVLDLGSGLGQYSTLLKNRGAKKVIALDCQERKALWLRDRLLREHEGGISVIVGSAEALPFVLGTFETVFSHTVFEHVGDLEAALRSVAAVLIAGGKFVVSFNYLTARGGHHLFPYVHFPWATWLVSEGALCEHWNACLAKDQAIGRMGFFGRNASVESLSMGNEIHLNRVTIEQFERLVLDTGFSVLRRCAADELGRCVPRWIQFGRLKEFLSGTVYYVLSTPPSPTGHC